MATPEQLSDLARLSATAEQFAAEIVIIGVAALQCFMDLPRFTDDIDLVVALDLENFAGFTGVLQANGWLREERREHRWRGPSGSIIDIVPAGPGLRAAGKLDWPDSQFSMSLAGFEHVFTRAVEVDLGDRVLFGVAPPPVVALLKIVAYMDDPQRRRKDLGDLRILFRSYEATSDRIFSDEVFAAELEDIANASGFLLGMDIGAFATDQESSDREEFPCWPTNPDRGTHRPRCGRFPATRHSTAPTTASSIFAGLRPNRVRRSELHEGCILAFQRLEASSMFRLVMSAMGGLFLSSLAQAAPCVTTACTEWITFGSGPSRSLIYRTYPLDAKNDKITRAMIMVHGAGRDADNYFRTVVAAAFLAGALDDTVVIAPRFASNAGQACRDTLAANEVNWNCNSWRSGGPATSDDKVTSFDFVDEILRKLARKDAFPNLRAIVVAGHSAGGQYVNRYEMGNQVHDKLGVAVTYVVSNPSSYAYPDSVRPGDSVYSVSARTPTYVPAPPDPAPPGGAADGSRTRASEGPAVAGFRPFGDGRNCTTYDQWPFGFKNRTGYTQKFSDDELKKQLAGRPTTYLLGELDVLPLGGFDGSCPAMAQGPTRLARGEAFSKYVNEGLGAHHTMTIIHLCGHNARCMFTAEPALPVLFPK